MLHRAEHRDLSASILFDKDLQLRIVHVPAQPLSKFIVELGFGHPGCMNLAQERKAYLAAGGHPDGGFGKFLERRDDDNDFVAGPDRKIRKWFSRRSFRPKGP
jgi:hypothetical protein